MTLVLECWKGEHLAYKSEHWRNCRRKQLLSPNMIFPKVLILTLFIFGTFAKGTIENIEEQFEVMERKLAALAKACTMADIETNRLTGQQMLTSIVSYTILKHF